ncbi:urea ABC transporter permease subunit UrtB [Teredinibacter franksiae]|uniref:urea ABC transporter permease subunit UrtB n=1 Tax=Teredinibacter franksiae TaxID=2761453 RepID=UPI001624A995|nr:urea ABC transporter permease subunit UrtB [Teredinibacter franksiae]
MKAKLIAAFLLLATVVLSFSNTYADNTADGIVFEKELATAEQVQFDGLVGELSAKSFSTKADVIDKLSNSKDLRALSTFKIMLAGSLYYQKSDKTIVTIEKVEGGFLVTSVASGEVLGVVGKRKVKKVTINNQLREKLRTAIAILELTADDKALRLESARNLIKSPDDSLRELLSETLLSEKSEDVRHLLQVAIARIDIKSGEKALRMAAVEKLGTAVEPEAVAVLNQLVEKDENGKYVEADKELAQLAEKKLKLVDTKLSFFKFAENLLFGISLGSVLLLAAIGLAITFGVMGVINMAHGEMIMLGAYTTFAIQQMFPNLMGVSLILAIPAAFLVSGTTGVLIERLVIRHLYGRPLDTLLATFGISLILQQAVRTYRANNVPVVTPEWMSGSWVINGAMSVTFNRIFILLFALFVLFMLALLLRKTLVGLQMRAVTQNRAMANSMGIRSNWVDALTFGLGSGIAGIAGVALSQITNVGPNLGQSYIIDSFMVVVFGGVGNLMGTFIGAMSLGIVNKFLEPVTGAVIGKIIVLVFIILFIQWRPRGLFALKGRFVED